MTGVEKLEKAGDELLLDWTGHNKVVLDDLGHVINARVEGKEMQLVSCTPDLCLDSLGGEMVITAPPMLRMHEAIKFAT